MINKSDFYKKYYARYSDPGEELNAHGYPKDITIGIDGEESQITTEEQWQAFLENELEVEQFVRMDEDAAAIAGVEWIEPYAESRGDLYPNTQEQLDGIYKCLMAIQASGIDLGEGQSYLDAITKVKTDYPKN